MTNLFTCLSNWKLKYICALVALLCIEVGDVRGADATMTGGSNATASTVNDKSAYKCGTGSKAGSMTVTVPTGANVLSFYCAGWNGKSVTVNIGPAAKVGTTSISPTSDSGISGTGTDYTLSGSESTYLYTISLTGITASTDITFSNAKDKQFVLWGAKYCFNPTSPSNTTIGSTTATLGWSDAKDVNNYEVYYNTSGTAPTAGSSGTTTTSKSINLTSLTTSQTYYWWVRAYDGYCKSNWVAGTSFTTSAGASCTANPTIGTASLNGSFF